MARRAKSLMKAGRGGSVFHSTEVTLHHCWIDGQPVTFCGTMWRDPIQKTHRKGGFYESEELALLAQLVPTGATIVDIGANVGNHTLYFGLFMKAAKVIPFEPNPLAYEVLLAHVAANGLAQVVDLSHIGLGLSNSAASGFAMEERQRNLGAASMKSEGGDIDVIRADSVLDDVAPDLIKLDVEGMEIEVLEGLGDIPRRDKPLMFVEVNHENAERFETWRDAQGYLTLHRINRYSNSTYHLMAHMTRAHALSAKIETLTAEKENA